MLGEACVEGLGMEKLILFQSINWNASTYKFATYKFETIKLGVDPDIQVSIAHKFSHLIAMSVVEVVL